MPKRNVTLYGTFTPNTNTGYKVEHYLENLDGTYGDDPAKTEDFTGTTGTEVTANIVPFEGFTFDEDNVNNVITGTILGNGSLKLKLYYSRNTYKVTYRYEGDVPAGVPSLDAIQQENVKYGAMVTVDTTIPNGTLPDGYSFIGWYGGTYGRPMEAIFEMPARDVTILGQFQPNDNTPYAIEHYLQKIGGGYERDGEADLRVGTTNEEVTVYARNYPGFVLNPSNETTKTGTISADGSLVIRFYYDRLEYSVTYELDGVQPHGVTATVPNEYNTDELFGDIITVKPNLAQTGYTFSGWTTENASVLGNEFTMPANAVVFKGRFTANDNVPYRVEYYLQKLNADGTAVSGINKETDYELQSGDTYDGTGRSGQLINIVPKHYEGFAARADNPISAYQ